MVNETISGNESESLQVWFMPWEASKVEFCIGPVTFWPFYRQAGEKILDGQVRQQLERYFDSYVDYQGRPAKSVTICSHTTFDLRQLSAEEIAEIQAAVDALIFSTISPANSSALSRANARHIVPPSADRYDLMYYGFTPGYEYFSISEGRNNHLGWKVGEVKVSKPWCIGGDFDIGDASLTQALTNVFNPNLSSDLRSRLFRSLEWFRLAHTEIHQVSVWSKVVMMATAFETFLAVPETQSKKIWIADEVQRKCVCRTPLDEMRRLQGKNGKYKERTYNKVAWWIWDFYDIRNAVVHGDELQPTRLGYQTNQGTLSQLNIADAVFQECCERELYANGCYNNVINWFAPWKPNYNSFHQALGWSA